MLNRAYSLQLLCAQCAAPGLFERTWQIQADLSCTSEVNLDNLASLAMGLQVLLAIVLVVAQVVAGQAQPSVGTPPAAFSTPPAAPTAARAATAPVAATPPLRLAPAPSNARSQLSWRTWPVLGGLLDTLRDPAAWRTQFETLRSAAPAGPVRATSAGTANNQSQAQQSSQPGPYSKWLVNTLKESYDAVQV